MCVCVWIGSCVRMPDLCSTPTQIIVCVRANKRACLSFLPQLSLLTRPQTNADTHSHIQPCCYCTHIFSFILYCIVLSVFCCTFFKMLTCLYCIFKDNTHTKILGLKMFFMFTVCTCPPQSSPCLGTFTLRLSMCV